LATAVAGLDAEVPATDAEGFEAAGPDVDADEAAVAGLDVDEAAVAGLDVETLQQKIVVRSNYLGCVWINIL